MAEAPADLANSALYDEARVAALFDRMGPTYDLVNRVSSFAFCELWRAQCVSHLDIPPGAVVADLMAGCGECWPYIMRHLGARGRLVSVDFSRVMCDRQTARKARLSPSAPPVEVRRENALATSIPDGSVEHVVSAFGLKTFSPIQIDALTREVHRILRPGGTCSFLEISVPRSAILRVPFMFYVRRVIPFIGRLLLGDVECYRMLGIYTAAFGSCASAADSFRTAGFEIRLVNHFFGCATALVGRKHSGPSE